LKYLAIDASGAVLTVVLKIDGKQYSFTEPQLRRTSAVLLPAVEVLLAEAGVALSDMDYFGVTLGPGSFTGIRVGLVTVKAWAYALGIPCVGVNSLLANAYISKKPCISLIDGSNGTTYIAVYDKNKNEIEPPRCIYTKDIKLMDGYEVVTGDNPVISLPLAIEAAIQRKDYDLSPIYIRKSQPERKAGEL